MKMFIGTSNKYKYVNCIIVSIILLFSSILFRKYLFQGHPFMSQSLLADLLRANLPTYAHLYDSIANGGNLWSWSMGIGTNMFSHADVYFDPFTYISFLGGREKIASMMIWVLIIKLIFEGIAFSYYVRYFELAPIAVIISSVLYAFSGYSMIMGSNLALGTVLVYFPLVLLEIEKFLDTGEKKKLIVMLFLLCIYSYYYFYVGGILSAGYMLIRCFNRHKSLLYGSFQLTICGILALCLGAFTVVPQVCLTLDSARVNSGKDVLFSLALFKPDFPVLFTCINRSIGLNLLGNPISGRYFGFAYNRISDYFQSEWYVSVFAMPLLFQYWSLAKDKRKFILFVLFLMIFLTLIPFFSYFFNGFSTINFRWMFICHLLICLVSGFSIDKLLQQRKINIKGLIICLFAIEHFLLFSYFIICNARNWHGIDAFQAVWSVRKYVFDVFLIYIIAIGLIYLYTKWQGKRFTTLCAYILLFGLFFTDTYINYYKWYASDAAVPHFTNGSQYGYDDESAKIIDILKSKDKSFYRIYKEFDSVYDDVGIPSDNDAMIQAYYGIKNYSSLNNKNYIKFLQNTGVYVAVYPDVKILKAKNVRPEDINGSQLNYINGIDDKYPLLNYLGVKYYLSKQSQEEKNMKILNIYFRERELMFMKIS